MNADPTAPMRHNLYRLLTIVAVAAVCARILSVERVYEPSIHRAEPPPDPAAIALPFAATSPPDSTPFVAAARGAPPWPAPARLLRWRPAAAARRRPASPPATAPAGRWSAPSWMKARPPSAAANTT